MKHRIYIFPAVLSLFLLSTGELFASSGCLVKFDKGIVVVKDNWSNRWSLPGGGSIAGEVPRDTAARETLEETGLHVQVGELLWENEGFRLFSCVSTMRSFWSEDSNGILLTTVPDSMINEVKSIAIVRPEEVSDNEWRFPSQSSQIKRAFELAPVGSRSPEIVTAFEAPRWLEVQIKWIENFQKLSLLKPLMHIFNFFGEKYFFFLILPWFLIGDRRTYGFKLIGAIVFSASLNGVLKEFFSLPRPLSIDPTVGILGASGFGFPSGHTQVASTFFMLLGIRYRKLLGVLLCMAALTGMARVYFGAHFVHDVVIGWGVGVIVACFVSKYWKPLPYFLLLCIGLFVRLHPDSVSMLMSFCGVFVLKGNKTENILNSRQIVMYTCCLSIAGLFGLPLVLSFLFGEERTFLLMLSKYVLIYFILGAWLASSTFFIPKFLQKYCKC